MQGVISGLECQIYPPINSVPGLLLNNNEGVRMKLSEAVMSCIEV